MSDLPIIVVSGRGGEQDKIEALDLGADDFIAKPFLPGELLARIRAALRRSAPLDRDEALALVRDVRLSSPTLTRGAVTLDYSELTLRLREQQVRLTEGEFKVLEVLVANAESTVNRAVILEALYGAGDARETKIVDVYVSRLRQKLGSLGGEADIIQNFRGRGWRFTAPTEY
jgi:DNA-binding response OmpR family regulator